MNERPAALNRAIAEAYVAKSVVAPAGIRWLSPLRAEGYRELGGMEYFADVGNSEVVRKWREFWPGSGRPPMWDGWAVADEDGKETILLVEAKANAPELVTPPSGASPESLRQIVRAFDRAKAFIGVPGSVPWHQTYYQYANRLAALFFLTQEAVTRARLIFLYFTGDVFPDGRLCPTSQTEWLPHIGEAHRALGLPPTHGLSELLMDVFVDVRRR